MLTYSADKRQRRITYSADFPRRYDVSSKTSHVPGEVVYGFLVRLGSEAATAASSIGHLETQIAILYDELAALARRHATGDPALDLREEISRKFGELRRLQAAQADEITRRFRESMKLSEDDFKSLEKAERILIERETTAESDDTPE